MIEKISFQAFIWYHSWLLRKPYLKQAGNTHLADFVAYRSVLAASDKSVPCGPRYTVYLVNIGVWDWKRKKKNWECWNVVCWNKINLIRDLLKLLWSSLLFAWLQTTELPATHDSSPRPCHHIYLLPQLQYHVSGFDSEARKQMGRN